MIIIPTPPFALLDKNAQTAYNIGFILDNQLSLYYFDDYYSLYLLNQVSDNIFLKDYCHKGILRLVKEDKKQSTNYAETLYEYMNNAYNLTKTAKKLHIHKNTMLYRLNRIREISKIESLEYEDPFKIQLTYKIMDYIKVFNQNVFD